MITKAARRPYLLKRKTPPALDPVGIGKRVGACRRKCGWRQVDMGLVMGVPRRVIWHIERGHGIPDIETALGLCVALRRSLEWLFFGLSGDGRLWKLSGN